MTDEIYSYDKIYTYEVVVENIHEGEWRGYIINKNENYVVISRIHEDPEECRTKLIKELTEYLDNFGAVAIDK